MMVTKDANMITILMGLIIMKANKKFQSNRLLRIFGILGGNFEDFCVTPEQLGRSGYSTSARIYLKGLFMWRRTVRQ